MSHLTGADRGSLASRRAVELLGVLAATCVLVAAQCAASEPVEVITLWPDGAPRAVGSEEADVPTLSVYLPAEDQATGTAIVICPGGGYGHLAVDHEGEQIARWVNSLGVAGFILRYRIAPRYHHPAPIQDAQRALRTVRAGAEKWGIDPARVGIIGFSAGGHLTSTASTRFDSGEPGAADPFERQSCRPDFAILGYPVISFTTEFVHQGSRRNLLGDDPSEEMVRAFSNELQVSAKTPPTFLFHASDDRPVPPENSTLYYNALRQAGVSAELHIYRTGGHGFGLGGDDPALSTWPSLCADWLRGEGFLPAK